MHISILCWNIWLFETSSLKDSNFNDLQQDEKTKHFRLLLDWFLQPRAKPSFLHQELSLIYGLDKYYSLENFSIILYHYKDQTDFSNRIDFFFKLEFWCSSSRYFKSTFNSKLRTTQIVSLYFFGFEASSFNFLRNCLKNCMEYAQQWKKKYAGNYRNI